MDARCTINNTLAFSDSTITLAWIHSSPHRWQTFIANRTSAIQEILAPQFWHHIPGHENPSDLISRPVTPNKLINNHTWFQGPEWMLLPHTQWPVSSFNKENVPADMPEAKAVSLLQTVDEPHPFVLLSQRVSKWTKLINAIVYVLRFAKILNSHGHITVADLETAETYLLKVVQSNHFASDMNALKNNKTLRTPVRKLNPFIDEQGILRVGGRLHNAPMTFEQKHPILLSSKDRVARLLVEYYHNTNLHTGPGLVLGLLRHKYWLLSARNLVRQVVHACNKCFKHNPKELHPLMGSLPDFRVTQQKCFAKSGVDFMGPINLTMAKVRGAKTLKAYVCLFVCLISKAIHVELVSDLSTEMFLAALKRFIARRGPISLIMSDGGRNFIGARRQLNEIYETVCSEEFNNAILRELTPQKIEYKINPPYAPHMGGIWESNLKNVKKHLYKMIGTQLLTYEEFNTILVQIEALMNSRPLCVLSSDPSEPIALTPSHFLNLTPLKYIPAENLDDIPINRLQRYKLTDKIVQSYWQRWHVEYLTSLQSREKWNTTSNPVKKGQVVILREERLPLLCWPLAVVEETYPGKDGITRVVKVKTKTGTYIRPVVRVCPLPTQ